MTIPDAFKTFVNEDGRIARLPVKFSKKVALSEWLLTLLDASQSYSEKELNEVFAQFVDDFALMRRMLVDAGKLERDAYGHEYRRVGSAA